MRLANGTEFSIGTGFSDAERENPPPIGTTVTFRYQELSDGVLAFPVILQVCARIFRRGWSTPCTGFKL